MKLSPITIYIIGIAFAIAAISFGLFYNAAPNNQEAGYYRTATDQLNAEAAKQGAAEKKLKKAKEDVRSVEAKWATIAGQHTPTGSVSTGGVDVSVNAFQLSEDTRKYRNSVQRAVNAQLRRGNVEVINGPLVPFDPTMQAGQLLASYYNYATAGYPVVIYNLGTVTVQGTYDQIMNNVRAYKSMPRYLAVTDGLTLDGTSPHLTATYNLTIVGYIPTKAVFGGGPEGQLTSGTGGRGGAMGMGGAMGVGGPAGGGMPGGGFKPSGVGMAGK